MITIQPRSEEEKAREFPIFGWKAVGYTSDKGEYYSQVYKNVSEAGHHLDNRGWEYEIKWS